MIEKKIYRENRCSLQVQTYCQQDRTNSQKRKGSKVLRNVIFSQGPPDSKIGEIMEIERQDQRDIYSVKSLALMDTNTLLCH